MIVVTGGTGLVGAHLLFALTKNGGQIRATYREEKKLANTRQVFASYTINFQSQFNRIDWVKADLNDIPALSKALKGATYVYHCAAFVSFEPDKYHILRRTNIEGTANVVNICIEYNIKKLCYVSSVATLGSPLKGKEITETTYWNPEDDNSVYGITKYGAEMEVWRGTQEGLDAVIVNPGVILGAGIWHYGTGNLFKKAHEGYKYYPKGSIGLVNVKDVIKIMIALTNSSITNERFIVVAENWSYKKFLSNLSTSVNGQKPKKLIPKIAMEIIWRFDWIKNKLIGKRRVITKHLAKSLMSEKHFSNEKIITVLNYSFEPIEETIKELGDQYLKEVQ